MVAVGCIDADDSNIGRSLLGRGGRDPRQVSNTGYLHPPLVSFAFRQRVLLGSRSDQYVKHSSIDPTCCVVPFAVLVFSANLAGKV